MGENSGAAVIIVGGQAHGIECLRSLGEKGVHTIAASARSDAPELSSKYCDEKVMTPEPKNNLTEYRDFLLELAERQDVRTIYPIQEYDALILSKYRSEFEEYVNIMSPSYDIFRSVHDRMRLMDVGKEVGVTVPETQPVDEVTDWERSLIIKPRYNMVTNDYVAELDENALFSEGGVEHVTAGEPPDLDQIRDRMGHIPIAMEYIRGEEYSVRALYDDGEHIVSSIKHQMRGKTYQGGASAYRESIEQRELRDQTKAILDELGWHGPCSVQFIEDRETGNFYLSEINPRFWGSISLDILAGVDYPYYYWQLVNGEDVNLDHEYKPGVRNHYLKYEVQYLTSILTDDFPNEDRPSFTSELGTVLWSIYEHPNFDYFRSDDPYPFIKELQNTASGLTNGIKSKGLRTVLTRI